MRCFICIRKYLEENPDKTIWDALVDSDVEEAIVVVDGESICGYHFRKK